MNPTLANSQPLPAFAIASSSLGPSPSATSTEVKIETKTAFEIKMYSNRNYTRSRLPPSRLHAGNFRRSRGGVTRGGTGRGRGRGVQRGGGRGSVGVSGGMFGNSDNGADTSGVAGNDSQTTNGTNSKKRSFQSVGQKDAAARSANSSSSSKFIKTSAVSGNRGGGRGRGGEMVIRGRGGPGERGGGRGRGGMGQKDGVRKPYRPPKPVIHPKPLEDDAVPRFTLAALGTTQIPSSSHPVKKKKKKDSARKRNVGDADILARFAKPIENTTTVRRKSSSGGNNENDSGPDGGKKPKKTKRKGYIDKLLAPDGSIPADAYSLPSDFKNPPLPCFRPKVEQKDYPRKFSFFTQHVVEKEKTIWMFGVDDLGRSIATSTEFHPWFYVRVPKEWTHQDTSDLQNKMATCSGRYQMEFEKIIEVDRVDLIGWTNKEKKKHLKISFKNNHSRLEGIKWFQREYSYMNRRLNKKQKLKVRHVRMWFIVSNVFVLFMHLCVCVCFLAYARKNECGSSIYVEKQD